MTTGTGLAAAELTRGSITTCCGLIAVGLAGIFLIAMISDENGKNENEVTISDILTYICGFLVVGSIVYLLPLSKEQFSSLTATHYNLHTGTKPVGHSLFIILVASFSFLFSYLCKRFMRYKRHQWAEEDRLKRSKGSRKKRK